MRRYVLATLMVLLILSGASPADADLIRFATYNTYYALQPDINPGTWNNLASVMNTIDTDVWAIQEIRNGDFFHEFFQDRITGLYETVVAQGNSGYQVGLASRFPIVEVIDHADDRDANGAKIFSRTALEVTIDIGGELMTVISTHLMPGYDRERRHLEGQRLAEIIGSLPADRMIVVMGDFNDVFSSAWDPLPSPVNLVQDAGLTAVPARNAESHSTATFSSTTPVVRYDYIFMSGQFYSQLVQHEVYSGSDAAAASDHLPVWAEVDVAIPEPASAVLWMTGTLVAAMFRGRRR